LSRDRSMLISTFLDTYLQLDSYEEEKFRAEFAKINPEERDEMLELTNNWFEAGKAEERQRTEQIQRERDAERQRADLAEREQKQERKKAEHEARRAEILAQRLRELGVDPDSLTD
ncbi:MAG: hypothetical protein WC314_26890, partial [Vulcanimicrobiota bacterium]